MTNVTSLHEQMLLHKQLVVGSTLERFGHFFIEFVDEYNFIYTYVVFSGRAFKQFKELT